MAARFLEEGSNAANAFASVQYNNTSGLVANAQQAAIDALEGCAEEGVSVLRRKLRRGL